MTSTVVYHVRPGNPAAHVYRVGCLIENPAPDGQTFSLPAWVPGSYTLRHYAKHVLSVSAESAGRALSVVKTDRATWQVEPVAGPLTIHAEIHAEDPSVRGANLDARSGFFNGVALFFLLRGREAHRCVLHLDPPEIPPDAPAWKVATSLRRLTGAEHEFGAFAATNYAELIDNPVLMGDLTLLDFKVDDIPHLLAIDGAHQADHQRLVADLGRLCAWHQKFLGRPADLDRYVFLLRLTGQAAGGLEHRHCSVLAAGRDSLPAEGVPAVEDSYRRFLGLASHEYFHLWHVKRIRPAELVGASLAREAYTRQLWIFEGITAYYDDLALLRCGLISLQDWLELLGRTLTRVYRSPGRRRQTLEEASFDAWIKFYRPEANSPNNTVSYYAKGALVALALDLELRLRSAGQCSLDEIMRALWARYGAPDAPGLAEGAFERLVEDLGGCDLGDFFQTALRSTRDLPLGILLARFGVRLHMRAPQGQADKGGLPARRDAAASFWLGMDTAATPGGASVAMVWAGSPAERAGLRTGDELVAVNGRRLTADRRERLLATVPADGPLVLHLFRDQELLQLGIVPEAAPHNTCYLDLDPAADVSACELRQAWLGA